MRARPAAVLAALAVAAAGALTGCASEPAARGTVTVAVPEPLTSLLADATSGGTRTNSIVAHLTGGGFGYYDDEDRLVLDDGFGKAEIVKQQPFTVRYTIADSAQWSDGRRVDANDLLLAWAAGSGALDTRGFDPTGRIDPSTGAYVDGVPRDAVYFDGPTTPGLPETVGTPATVPGGRAIDVVYRQPFADWAVAIEPTLSAHALGRTALKAPSDEAADAVGEAILKRSTSDLAAISRSWNAGIRLRGTATVPGLLAASGPFRISAVAENAVTLSANPGYHGARTPGVARIVIETVADPAQAVARLVEGSIDIAAPRPSDDVLRTLVDAKGIRVTQGVQGVVEHLDLRVADSASNTFGDAEVREAFLKTVPRREMLAATVGGIDADAELLQSFTLLPSDAGYVESVAENGSEGYASADDAAIQRATELLQFAGVRSPRVCILYDPNDPLRVAEYGLIKKSADEAGFVVTDCSSPDWATRLTVPGTWDAALVSWDTTHLGPTAIAEFYRSEGSGANRSGFSDARVDTLVARLASVDAADDRTELLTAIDRRIWQQHYGLPLYQDVAIAGIGSRVHGVSLSPQSDGVFWNAWEWRVGQTSAG